jgi:microcystin-dependent protein
MRALLYRALANLWGAPAGMVYSDGGGRLQSVTAAAGRTALAACADDDPRLSDARTPLAHDHNGTYYTQAQVDALIASIPAGGVPAGVVCMWSGLLANLPAGWALCDGQNGAPDLRDRFVKGWSAGAAPGTTGGSAAHQHTYSEVPNHTHPVAIDDPGHTHVETTNSATTGGLSGWAARDTSTNTPVATGYSTQPATTGITASAGNPAGGVAQGTTDAASSEPPFFIVAFIIKL